MAGLSMGVGWGVEGWECGLGLGCGAAWGVVWCEDVDDDDVVPVFDVGGGMAFVAIGSSPILMRLAFWLSLSQAWARRFSAAADVK